MRDPLQRVRFDNPPLVEVVCGVTFETNPLPSVAQLGGFALSMRPDFPSTRDLPPLSPKFERPVGHHHTEISISDCPPIPRQWLIAKSGSEIIQIQQDRLHYNWKRDPQNSYPNYEGVYSSFSSAFERFFEFLNREGITDVLIKQYEMTYVNIIEDGSLDLQIFNDFKWKTVDRFLPIPESFSWGLSHALPGSNGRLHANAQSVVAMGQEQKKAIKLEMTARGYPADESIAMADWFDIAHNWITHGFADLTSSEFQQSEWKRVQ